MYNYVHVYIHTFVCNINVIRFAKRDVIHLHVSNFANLKRLNKFIYEYDIKYVEIFTCINTSDSKESFATIF